MRAVACHEAQLKIADVAAAEPEHGQVLLRVLRCGICGSDLHAREHCDALADVLSEIGYDEFMRSGQEVVFGHEFSGEVAEYGRGCRKRIPTGAHVVALPLIRREGEPHPVGLSAKAPGAYAEAVLVEESLMMAVPNGLSPDLSALTEPMAIGWHAVRRSEIGKRDVAIVIGCGPIGLAVICLLKARGVRTIVASDFSAARRELAERCGAGAVDPARESPYEAGDGGHVRTLPDAVELAISTSEKLQRLPVPWQHVWRAIDAVGIAPKRPVVFECVGLPGVLDSVIASAPLFSRVIGVGVCMGEDRIRPSMAINKEIDLRFVVGYTPLEFRDTLHMLADGKVDPAPLLTGVVGLDGVASAFDALAGVGGDGSHAKILIDPSRTDAYPVPPGPR
ncbi:MAG TPA: zinc-binding dehydrogenase [Solirubrobacteraceae bacterium]|nr:zinc-binding dehydrogenase [Solirubrobacteraceae bacterium]